MARRDESVRRGSYRDPALEFPERGAAADGHGSGDRCPTCGRYRRRRSRPSVTGAREQVALALEGIAAAYGDAENLRAAIRDLAEQLREPVEWARPRRRRG